MMAIFIIFCAQYLFLAEGLLGLYTFWRSAVPQRRILVLRAVVMGVVAVLLDQLAAMLYFEPRPFVRLHVTPLVQHVADNSFPSDHTLLAFGIALLILPFAKRAGILAVVLAALVAWGRVASLVHSPLDVVTSILIAVVANGAAILVVRNSARLATDS